MVLQTNGYPQHIINRTARPKVKQRQQEEPPKYTVCLPYVKGIGEDLRRVCRKYDIRTIFNNMDTFRRQLTRVKDSDPTLTKACVVYKIPSLVPRLSTRLHRKYEGAGRRERKRAWYEPFAHARIIPGMSGIGY